MTLELERDGLTGIHMKTGSCDDKGPDLLRTGGEMSLCSSSFMGTRSGRGVGVEDVLREEVDSGPVGSDVGDQYGKTDQKEKGVLPELKLREVCLRLLERVEIMLYPYRFVVSFSTRNDPQCTFLPYGEQ